MGKSLVERYEQILSQDPSSSVFVEMAKALIERGDSGRAITVCEQGLAFHPRSVVARVLWGKALINLGRPAEAMEQFDQAVAIDRENPHAYNLIGEVLLRKGLYRSALPLLRKAVALQPEDGRVRQWLEQTERALSGGPAPALGDETVMESGLIAAAALEPPAPEPGEAAPTPPAPTPAASPTESLPGEMPAVIIADALLATQREIDEKRAERTRSQEIPRLEPQPVHLHDGGTGEMPAVGAPTTSGPAGEDDASDDEKTEAAPGPRADAEGGAPTGATPEERPAATGPKRLPTFTPMEAPAAAPIPGILADIPLPDLPPPAPSLVDMPKVEVSSQAALAIAQEYERELREKLRATAEEEQRTFVARHWVKMAFAGVLVVALGAGSWMYQHTRTSNQNRTLRDEIARARQALSLDTRPGYVEAIAALTRALEMDASSVEADALHAYAHAMMFADFGHANDHRDQARLSLARVGVKDGFPGLALVAEYYLANEDIQSQEKKRILGSKLEDTEVQTLAGKLLLEQGDAAGAVARFDRALKADAKNIRALMALAGYYRTHEDYRNALNVYTGLPLKLAPEHPERVIGAAECRLALHSELDVSRTEVERLKTDGLSREQRIRRALALGKLLGYAGEAEKAVALLTEEGKLHAERGFDFEVAIGDARRRAGDWVGAQRSAETAVRARPNSEEARELLGRILLGRDRERELLTRLTDDGSRRVRLLRGIAFGRVGDWKRARAELEKTQVNGKFPPEAVIHLALADAAEGQAERAQSALERVLGSTKRARAEVQVALGKVYWQRGLVDRARAQFEEAAKDPEDYEGGCALGRLLIALGLPEAALAPLVGSVTRNGFHGEALQALARANLQLGRTSEALKRLEAWQNDNPTAAAAHRDYAFALSQEGRWKEAETAIARAVKLAPRDAEAHRVRSALFFARGDLRGGFAELELAKKLNAADPEIHCAIARAYLRRAHFANAQKAYDSARNVGSPACARIGPSLVKPATGRPQIAELAQLGEQAPQIWDRGLAEAARSRALLASGAVKEARTVAEQAIKLAPFLGEAHLSLAMALSRTRDEDKAQAAFEKTIALEPGDARVHLAYGDALAKSPGDAGRAVNEYQLFLKIADHSPDVPRVKRALPALKKRLAAR